MQSDCIVLQNVSCCADSWEFESSPQWLPNWWLPHAHAAHSFSFYAAAISAVAVRSDYCTMRLSNECWYIVCETMHTPQPNPVRNMKCLLSSQWWRPLEIIYQYNIVSLANHYNINVHECSKWSLPFVLSLKCFVSALFCPSFTGRTRAWVGFVTLHFIASHDREISRMARLYWFDWKCLLYTGELK